MSGIQTGTRLDKLRRLRTRVGQQIIQAHRREAFSDVERLRNLANQLDTEIARLDPTYHPPTHRGRPRTRAQKANDRVTRHLARLGVTAHEVKAWAVTAGLIDAIHRGRIRAELVQAYETAHQGAHP